MDYLKKYKGKVEDFARVDVVVAAEYSRKAYGLEAIKDERGSVGVRVYLEIRLSKEEWEDFTEDFFKGRGWLEDIYNLGETEALITTKDFTGAILVDTQGYDYARYTAYVEDYQSKIK